MIICTAFRYIRLPVNLLRRMLSVVSIVNHIIKLDAACQGQPSNPPPEERSLEIHQGIKPLLICFIKPLCNAFQHNIIRYAIHYQILFHLFSQLSFVCYGVSKQITSGNMGHIKVVSNRTACVPLPAPGAPKRIIHQCPASLLHKTFILPHNKLCFNLFHSLQCNSNYNKKSDTCKPKIGIPVILDNIVGNTAITAKNIAPTNVILLKFYQMPCCRVQGQSGMNPPCFFILSATSTGSNVRPV